MTIKDVICISGIAVAIISKFIVAIVGGAMTISLVASVLHLILGY